MTGLHVCEQCRLRSQLVEQLGVRFDVRHCDTERMAALLALPDDELAIALGFTDADSARAAGRSKGSQSALPSPRAGHAIGGTAAQVLEICRHDPLYPLGPGRAEAWAPPAVLRAAGDVARAQSLSHDPAVAIVGTRRATDYGLDVAHNLACELAGAGLAVISGLAEGIAAAALTGSLKGKGTTISVMAGGVDVCAPADRRTLYDAILTGGCILSEHGSKSRARRWAYAARNRIISGLASVVVVVEAEQRPGDLMLPRFAQTLGRPVAAVPGRVTSASSRGTHELLAAGAHLIRDAQDVLDVLCGAGAQVAPSANTAERRAPPGRHSSILALVSRGADTLDALRSAGVGYEQAIVALTELELAGRLIRGDGGRYLLSVGRPRPRAA